MPSRTKQAFLALVILQTAHSIEEYFYALFDVFPPARLVAGLVSADRSIGFIVVNVTFVLFGVWVYLVKVRPDQPAAAAWMWPWVLVEIANGIVHPVMALLRGGYFPGVVTAPALGVVAAYLGWRLTGNWRAGEHQGTGD
jgi:Protein of unknown function with HXXEE motif